MTTFVLQEWSMEASHFAGRLRELREAKGWTREQLAEASGLKAGGIRDIEQGLRLPGWETVLSICDALGVMPNTFTMEPAPRPEPRRGRPPKLIAPSSEPAKPVKQRGRKGK
jgi:transcriptional regulator with XRE-family HTH domain